MILRDFSVRRADQNRYFALADLVIAVVFDKAEVFEAGDETMAGVIRKLAGPLSTITTMPSPRSQKRTSSPLWPSPRQSPGAFRTAASARGAA